MLIIFLNEVEHHLQYIIVLIFVFLMVACSTTFKQENDENSAQNAENREITLHGKSSIQVKD